MANVAVVGAGWSGLAAATFLRQRGHEVHVFESADKPGGRIATHRDGGYLVEAGPHGIVPEPAAARELVQAADVEFLEAPQGAPRFVVHHGRPVALPAKPPHLLRTPLLTARAKLRLLAEPFARGSRGPESVAAFARRRLGSGVEHLLDAFVTGVYAGDPERLSVAHAFPRLTAMEREGGLLRSLARTGKTAPARPTLAAPREGMQAWVEALARNLPITYGTRVDRVEERSDHALIEQNGATVRYDHAIIATEPEAAARLLRLDAPTPPRAPVAIVAFGAPAEQLPREGYGVLAPERAQRFCLGALYESALFAHRAPAGRGLVRCLVGGRRHPERAKLPDDELIERAWRDLTSLGIVRGDHERAFVLRTAGIPQPELGHEAWLDALPNGRVRVLGIGHGAVGLAALAQQARELRLPDE